ncbi:MAG: hypothetical protein KF769_16255 [Parvibaculum sp.]|nr:hypothetical protein [Parvibaculum sp.]
MSCRSINRRRHWLAAALAVAFLLTTVAAPVTDVDMMASAYAMAEEDAPTHMAHGAGDMAGPCCDDCDHADTKSCDSSALCMTACGKLPLQLAAVFGFVLAERAIEAVRAPDIGRADLSPSPLRRPPRAV